MTSYRAEHADRIRTVGKVTANTLDRFAGVFDTLAGEASDLVARSEYETLAKEARLNAQLTRMAINRQTTRLDGRAGELKGEAA